jgi:hypothetical protein
MRRSSLWHVWLRPIGFAGLLAGLWVASGLSGAVRAQEMGLFEEAGPSAQHLIDLPTANVLPKGTGSMALRISSGGGLLGGIYAGLANRLVIGLSFGGTNLIGAGKVAWNPRPEVAIKYLLIEESDRMPAIATGFESQGYGPYDDTLNRYQIKSRGLYAVFSRRFILAGTFTMMGGINYSVEHKDGDSRLSAFLGAEKSINDHLSILAEYDFARNDNLGLPGYGRERGYLNLGARVTLGGQVGLEFDLRNLLNNRVGSVSPSRELKIMYTENLSF